MNGANGVPLDPFLQAGDNVEITEGTFKSFEGTVSQIQPSRLKVVVLIAIYGRATPVEVGTWQVKKV